MKEFRIKLNKYFDVEDKNNKLTKGILNLKDYIGKNVDKLTLYINQDFISNIDKYHIKKIVIPCVKNISIYIDTIKRDIKLELDKKYCKLKNLEIVFFSYKQEKNLKFTENFIKNLFKNIVYVEELKIDSTGKTRLNLDLLQYKISIRKLNLLGLNDVKINFIDDYIENLIINNVNNIFLKGLKKINKLLLEHIKTSKINKKDYQIIFQNFDIKHVEIKHCNLNIDLLFNNLKYLNISYSKINNLELNNYKGNYCDIYDVQLENLKINQNKNNKTQFTILNLFIKNDFYAFNIKHLYIENSCVKNIFSIHKSKQIEILNTLAKNIDINNVKNVFYSEKELYNHLYHQQDNKTKFIKLSIKKANYVKFLFEINKKNFPEKKIILEDINKVSIKFSTKFEKKIEINNNIDLIVNYDNLLTTYMIFKNIMFNNIKKLDVVGCDGPYGICTKEENCETIKEFFNILQNKNENENMLESKILNYFFQNNKDKTWLENNLKSFKNYEKIANKINNKIMCI